MNKYNKVALGSVITVLDFNLNKETSYKIVSTGEKNLDSDNELSIDCPLAKALKGGGCSGK